MPSIGRLTGLWRRARRAAAAARELVPRHWLSDEQFLAGYAAARAVPARSSVRRLPGRDDARGRVRSPRAGLTALFLPGYLFLVGAPFWDRLRRRADAQAHGSAALTPPWSGCSWGRLIDPLILGTIHSALMR